MNLNRSGDQKILVEESRPLFESQRFKFIHQDLKSLLSRIVGLYTTFVIVVGWSMKSSLTNTSSKTMFEDMPYVDRILQVTNETFSPLR